MVLILVLLSLVADGQTTLPLATPLEDVNADSHGLWITARISIAAAEDAIGGNTFYGCTSNDEISRSVCFRGLII